MNYVNTKQKKIISNKHSIQLNQGHISDQMTENIEDNNRWRGSCQIDQRETLIKHEQQPYFSYKVNILNTIFNFYFILFQDSR